MSKIELFVQHSGNRSIDLVNVDDDVSLEALIGLLERQGLAPSGEDELLVSVEVEQEPDDAETAISGSDPSKDARLGSLGIRDRSRIHVHRCRTIKVTVNFNHETKSRAFRPSATVRQVRRWANRVFSVPPVDATETVLQLCGTTDQPNEDLHIGSLTIGGACEVCLDLIVKQRVEG